MRWPPPPSWPNVAWSRQVLCAPHRWHIQETGSGDTLILLHGAGGATHSYRDLLPRLAETYHVVALDLPGHGFTRLGARHRSGIDPMAADLAALIAQQGWHPRALIGHSAGGALALRVAPLLPSPPLVIGLNPALRNFDGVAGVLFPALAKLLALSPFSAALFAQSTGRPEAVRQLIRSTGSALSPAAIEEYRMLIANREHVDGTLLMMAQWSLDGLRADLPDLTVPARFVVGARDSAVPPASVEEAAALMPDAQVRVIEGLGHLLHEEAPDLALNEIAAILRAAPKQRAADDTAAHA